MTRASAGTSLVKELQTQVKKVATDLRERSDRAEDAWASDLKAEYEHARERGRTGLTWSEWRDGEVDLAAVAWVLATVFIRFCEDNSLIDGPWITGAGARYSQAADNETAFYAADPTRNSRDWLQAGFGALADLPAGRDLLDRRHNLVWRAPISADASAGLLNFWRTQDVEGNLVHDLTDHTLDTRFLGDLYQDLSDYAKKKYALLQTPVFVEEFILDRTLTPAIDEFGIDGLKLIDPTCGSGHFLLGAFDRLLNRWQTQAPAMDARQRVQKALDSIHGVDLNPFAVAIARFRLTVVALKAAGITKLTDAPAFEYHLAVGDSLIKHGVQTDLLAMDEDFAYMNEDVAEHPSILDRGRYHVVVGNPPYITVKDKALNERYRQDYRTCHRQYALSVPFMELFFDLAVKGGSEKAAGYVGQITSNSFMKREFGSKVIEELLSGTGSLQLENPVDLTYVLDTSGAYIPGHGTPTVILIGRHRRPVGDTVRAALGVRGEPGAPEDPAHGLVWSELMAAVDHPDTNGQYLTITDIPRGVLSTHPWSLSGGGTGDLKVTMEAASLVPLADVWEVCGFGAITGEDEAFAFPHHVAWRLDSQSRSYIRGEDLRDFGSAEELLTLWPYEGSVGKWHARMPAAATSHLWSLRTNLKARKRFGNPMSGIPGLAWFEFREPYFARLDSPMLLTFAFVATHNHFVLDRGGKVFNRSAPVIKLPVGATEDEYLDLLGVLNSSTACFWLKQVSHGKGNGGVNEGMRGEDWEEFYEFTGTKLQEFPLPQSLPRERARRLDVLAQRTALSLPAAVLGEAGGDLVGRLGQAQEAYQAGRAQLVFEQEELDWGVYRSYGLIDEDMTYSGGGMEQIALGQRAFEIALARRVADGSESTAWFERHGSTAITELPGQWPEDYRALVQRRLDLIASDPFIGLLERPEYKRRWASASWEQMQAEALGDFILDRLEESSLWSDASGPSVLSVAQLADRVRGDAELVEAVCLLRGAVEVDLTAELGRLLADESVPFLSAYRYKDSGLRKRAEWESVWDLQRREDAGETVSIPVPPKYAPGDFRKVSYWQARGKLDVPKERFISYPGAQRPGDPTLVVGWAGWDHLEQGRALARLIAERSMGDGLDADKHLAMVGGLVELEPWLHQWFAEPDATFRGASPSAFVTQFIDSQLSALGKTRSDAQAWRP